MRATRAWAALLTAGACGAPARPALVPTPALVDCRLVDSAAGTWRAAVFIDGQRVGDHLRARREQVEPETFELGEAEPPLLAALGPERIDLIQFTRGEEAEATLGLCPGYVAFLVTTKPLR